MATPNIYGSTDIYAPVEQAQKFAEQQNALARQKAVRNALGNAIDPRTGRTNWEFAQQVGGADVAPELQQMQQAEMMTEAKLAHEQGLARKAGIDAQTAYWLQQRDTAARIGDQPSWTTWRSTLPAQFQQYVPEKYTPENQRMTLATGDEALKMYKPDIQFQNTAAGVEGIDVSPYSPTYKKTVIQREAAPKSSGVNIYTGDTSANEFGKGVGKGAAEQFNDSYSAAKSARTSYGNTDKLYQFVNSNDFISGPAGDWRGKAASFLGLPGVAETDAYFSQIGGEVAQVIKQFGAGTGLSDNDRKYAEQIAGGQRALTKETIRTIMYMRQMANRNLIKSYNEDRSFKDKNNPKANISGLYQEIPVPPPPSFNGKGWSLHQDKNGNYAYVSPDGKHVQEVQ